MNDDAVGIAGRYPVTFSWRGHRLDRFLQAMVPRMSRTAIQNALATRVRLSSGAEPKASRRLVEGEVVTILAIEPAAVPTIALPVLAEGAGWLAIDKPAGVAATPNARRPGTDVASRLGLAPAHRLDRGTSGCLLLTRDAATARHFDLAFRQRRIGKEYLAVVDGTLAADEFVVDAPLGIDPRSRVTNKVAVAAEGAPASTRCVVLARGSDRTLVRALPATGRRHQIRVHLAHVGHPIVGDLLYGADERQFIRFQRGQPVDAIPGVAPGRHLLHAHRLVFPAPGSDGPIEVRAPVPTDFGDWGAEWVG